MTLCPIHTMGISAWCSDLIIDPEDMETVYFMSLCGYQVAVKGIVANFLEEAGINVDLDGEAHYLSRSELSYNIKIKKLPSGLVHAVVMPKLAFPKSEETQNRFFVITRERRDILELFFKHLDEKTEIPLHPSWSKWLWKTFKKQDDWLLKLKTLTGEFQGYQFYFHPTQLHDLIAEAIKNKVSAVVRCLTWKGDRKDETNHTA